MHELLAALVAVLLGAKLLGAIAQRLGQPAVLGELVAGILLGGSVLGVLDPANPAIHALAEIGVLVLLFEIGLHTDLRSLASVGGSATTVAVVGVALPFALGWFLARALGLATIPALVAAASLTATSVGISARVLGELGVLEQPEGRVVLGAAVLDDIIGLVILSVVSSTVAGAALSGWGIARTAGVAIGFVVLAVVLGARIAPPVFRFVARVQMEGVLGPVALAFALLLAWLAAEAGSATIIGAFAAGLVLHNTPQRADIEGAVTNLGHFVVPIFFASVGAAVDLRALASRESLLLGALLVLAGIAGKVAAGYAPLGFRGRKLLIGVAMVPRGEVGLIFAQMGLASGAIDAGVFGAIMVMVLVTTLVTPPALARIARNEGAGLRDLPGEGGIDDLVAGTRRTPIHQRSVERGAE
ncbi:MAG TPA: cation:proton antiporter [Gemmatimonadaceae bacterium]|nr:cation:proton antiporter [Gemmatimonadaceae bacterium]